MISGLLGKKIGMTQLFSQSGRVTPVTVLETGPCAVLQVKTLKTDGYNAVQVGFDEKKKKGTTKPLAGHFDKAKVTPKRLIKEFRLPFNETGEKEATNFKLGDSIKVDIFENTWKVNVTGTTKGRGFTGMVKRWNKKRGPASHGSMNVRGVGSIGSDTRLTHVRVGKHMPGHYGVETVTVKNLEIAQIDKNRNLLFVKGAVPGPNGAYVVINKTNLVKPLPPKPSKEVKKEPRKEPKKVQKK